MAACSSVQLQDLELAIDKATSELPKSGQKRRKVSKGVTAAKRKKPTATVAEVNKLQTTDDAIDMSKWEELGAPAPVVMALQDLKFSEPTAVQSSSIPPALVEGKDVIGAAETGSGKTLAYGIPVLTKILSVLGEKTETTSTKDKRLTKKKTIRVEQSEGGEIVDLNQVLHSRPEKSVFDTGPEQLEVGGASGNRNNHGKSDNEMTESIGTCVYFQDDIPDDEFEQMLRGVEGDVAMVTDVTKVEGAKEGEEINGLLSLVVVPTRELAFQVKDHLEKAAKYTRIKIVGLVGGMALPKQERQLRLHPHVIVATPGRLWKFMSDGNEFLSDFSQLQSFVLDEADRMVEHGHFHELQQILKQLGSGGVDGEGWGRVQKFIFSATLTMEKEKRGKGKKKDKKKSTSKEEPAEKGSIEELIAMVGINKDRSVTVDLTSQQLVVKTLTEAKITCGEEDKDLYLLFFLSTYPGRTLIFVNTIDHLKQLQSLLTLLGCQPHCLHAGMQQRQRLKNLERFAGSEQGLLLASDVAARGLDIPKVQHVIHYHVPKNSDVYVHRSGRTARAQEEGLSVMLVGPKDLKYYRQICRQLNKDQDLPLFPVEARYLPACRARVHLAHRIERTQRSLSRGKKSDSWLLRSAKAMDIDLDDNLTVERRHSQFKVHCDDLGEGEFSVTVEPPSAATIKTWDLGQLGRPLTYHVTLVPKEPGKHQVSVTHSNEHIQGSPFLCTFAQEEKAKPIYICRPL